VDFVLFDVVFAIIGIVMMTTSKKMPIRVCGVLALALGSALLAEDSLVAWTSINHALAFLVFVAVLAAMFLLAIRTVLTPPERKSFWQFSWQRLRGH
jgi:hypothetical protein